MLHSVPQHCPYCGEPIELLVEAGAGDQDYVEDCQVCCRPMRVHVRDACGSAVAAGDDPPLVTLGSENEI